MKLKKAVTGELLSKVENALTSPQKTNCLKFLRGETDLTIEIATALNGIFSVTKKMPKASTKMPMIKKL